MKNTLINKLIIKGDKTYTSQNSSLNVSPKKRKRKRSKDKNNTNKVEYIIDKQVFNVKNRVLKINITFKSSVNIYKVLLINNENIYKYTKDIQINIDSSSYNNSNNKDNKDKVKKIITLEINLKEEDWFSSLTQNYEDKLSCIILFNNNYKLFHIFLDKI